MSTAPRHANLRRLLYPESLVFLGGERVGGAVEACRKAGYTGRIHVVHPKRNEIAGIKCSPSIAALPEAPDAAYLAIAAEQTIQTVGELAAVGAGGAVCYASGFSELGTDVGRERHRRLVAAASDLAIVGPNCFGVVNYVNHGSLWSVPYPASGPRGAAVIGQSGNLCINLSMNQRQVPFSWIISAGNQAVLGFEDYLDFLVEAPEVTAVGLFMEGIRDVTAFSAACRKAYERGIPIAAFRVGVSELGAKLAASHTSSLAGQNELYDTLFERLGVMQTASVPQFLELLKTASLAPLPKGRRVAVFSSSGGDNGMAADYLSGAGLELPQPNETQRREVKALLPDYGQVSNPLDFTAGYWGQEQLLTPMFTSMLREGYDQGMIVIDHPRPELGHGGEALYAMARSVANASRATGVPGIVCCVNPESMPEPMRQLVIDEGLLPLQGLHDAGAVLARWARHAERRRAGAAPVLPLAVAPIDIAGRTLDEVESKARLAKYGLPVPQSRVVALAEVAAAAKALVGPLALKAVSSALPHKTEAGGVALNIRPEEAQRAAEAMAQRVRAKAGVTVDRFLLEPMAKDVLAELLIGVKRDALFGLVLVIASGGVLVELVRDAERLLLPATGADIERAIQRLKVYQLMQGFRGRPAGDLAAAVRAVEAVAAYAVAQRDRVLEIDVNPLMIQPQGAVAVDALIVEA
jgi:acetate---CoA ligase (ADP-forming)